jgi:hypothetical protein
MEASFPLSRNGVWHLAYENDWLSHAGCFDDKAAQDQAAKTQGDNTPHKTPMFKPLTDSTPWAPTVPKGTYVALTSTQPPADQKAHNKQKGTAVEEDKEILANPNNLDNKLQISSNVDPK